MSNQGYNNNGHQYHNNQQDQYDDPQRIIQQQQQIIQQQQMMLHQQQQQQRQQQMMQHDPFFAMNQQMSNAFNDPFFQSGMQNMGQGMNMINDGNNQSNFQSFSSSSTTRIGPDGVMRVEKQEDSFVDDGKSKPQRRQMVAKETKGPNGFGEVQLVETDYTTGETKIEHTRELGDKKRQRIQTVNIYDNQQQQQNTTRQPQISHDNANEVIDVDLTQQDSYAKNTKNANHNVVDNLYNLDPNEIDTFDQQFNNVKNQHIDFKQQTRDNNHNRDPNQRSRGAIDYSEENNY